MKEITLNPTHPGNEPDRGNMPASPDMMPPEQPVERAEIFDNVVERFIGNDRRTPGSGEAIVGKVENAALSGSGNGQALQRMMDRLEPGVRQKVAATIAGQLGRRGVDGDDAFSVNLFLSQVTKCLPRARAAIFGQQDARDLTDLAYRRGSRRNAGATEQLAIGTSRKLIRRSRAS